MNNDDIKKQQGNTIMMMKLNREAKNGVEDEEKN